MAQTYKLTGFSPDAKAAGFNARVTITQQPNLPQPFGALGGMSHLCEHFALRVTLNRVNYDYTLSSMQNAHLLVTAAVQGAPSADEGSTAADALHHSLAYLACTPEQREVHAFHLSTYPTAYGEVTTAYADPPQWFPRNRNGPYGTEYHARFSALHQSQLQALAFERALLGQLPKDAPWLTSTCGVAAVRVEATLPSEWRTATDAESKTVYQFMHDYMSTMAASARAEAKTPTEHAWLLKARAKELEHLKAATTAAWFTDAKDNEAIIRGSGEPFWTDRTTEEGAAFAGAGGSTGEDTEADNTVRLLHISVVAAHSSFRGAGSCMLKTVCALADQLGTAVMIEALPNDNLPLYYAKQYGFELAVFVGGTQSSAAAVVLDKTRLLRQGFVHMIRRPGGCGAGAGAGSPPAHPSTGHMQELMASLSKLTLYSNKGADKLHQLHLATAAAEHLTPLLHWRTNTAVAAMTTWAKEFTRQMERGEVVPVYGPKPAYVPPPPPPAEILPVRVAKRPATTVAPSGRPQQRARLAAEDPAEEGGDVTDRPSSPPVRSVEAATQVTPGRFPGGVHFHNCVFNAPIKVYNGNK